MKKIKTILIHLLGGVTEQELKDGRVTSYINGRRVEAVVIQCVMRDLYGLAAEEWCDAAWKCVTEEVNNINKRYNEEV